MTPLRSFMPVSPDSHFPIQNLPYGVFRPKAGGEARVGVAVGDFVLDLAELERRGLVTPMLAGGPPVFDRHSLNAFMALGRDAWRETRARLTELLRNDSNNDNTELRDNAELRAATLFPQSDVELLLPVEIGDYTDFYSSKHHAENIGTMLRGKDNALQPNWLHLPVAYHGRASSIVASGTDICRPNGQTMPEGAAAPSFGPTKSLDYELEMGFFIGPSSALGRPVSTDDAMDHIFGMVLVNDWSARDIQKWEYQPLGPFLSKNFATSISPWVVTMEALSPFRTAGPLQDPRPLPYLHTNGDAAYDIELEVALQTETMADPQVICRSNFKYQYWNMRQQLAHHTVSGCNLRTGDLLASGTISGPTPESRGCLLERTWGGQEPIELPAGEVRRFLVDGDRVSITGWCQGKGYRVGFGEVTGRMVPCLGRESRQV